MDALDRRAQGAIPVGRFFGIPDRLRALFAGRNEPDARACTDVLERQVIDIVLRHIDVDC